MRVLFIPHYGWVINNKVNHSHDSLKKRRITKLTLLNHFSSTEVERIHITRYSRQSWRIMREIVVNRMIPTSTERCKISHRSNPGVKILQDVLASNVKTNVITHKREYHSHIIIFSGAPSNKGSMVKYWQSVKISLFRSHQGLIKKTWNAQSWQRYHQEKSQPTHRHDSQTDPLTGVAGSVYKRTYIALESTDLHVQQSRMEDLTPGAEINPRRPLPKSLVMMETTRSETCTLKWSLAMCHMLIDLPHPNVTSWFCFESLSQRPKSCPNLSSILRLPQTELVSKLNLRFQRGGQDY